MGRDRTHQTIFAKTEIEMHATALSSSDQDSRTHVFIIFIICESFRGTFALRVRSAKQMDSYCFDRPSPHRTGLIGGRRGRMTVIRLAAAGLVLAGYFVSSDAFAQSVRQFS